MPAGIAWDIMTGQDRELPMLEKDIKAMRIGVLMGGLSREREISLRSGSNCHAALKRLGYDAVAIDVGRDIAAVLNREQIAAAFLALHGRYGEDGCIQGLLEMLDIPYTGSGVMASALAMNKVRSKELAMYHDIPTPPCRTFDCRGDLDAAVDAATRELNFPVMVKPCEEGSSLGVSKVAAAGQLMEAVAAACRDYDTVLAEEYVEGDEITVGLLETGDGLVALPVLQLVPRSGFYDYQAKYQEGMTEFILPAAIAPETASLSQELAMSVHRVLGCRGFSRVDFMIDAGGVPQFTELNTLPGMTDTSDLPAQALEAGISYDELVEIMLQSAFLP